MRQSLVLVVWLGLIWTQASSGQVAPPTPTNSVEVPVASAPNGLPPLPQGTVTLFGGTIRDMDQVRDRILLQTFGGGETAILFDARTSVYRNGTRVSARELRRGDRVYVDTVLDGKNVFARSIRLQNQASGQSNGQVIGYDRRHGELTLRDTLAPGSVRIMVDSATVILRDDRPVAVDELRPGSLVTVQFRAGGAGQAIANRVSLLAAPGSQFVFVGKVVHLDESRHLLVVSDPRDNQSYTLRFDPSAVRAGSDLHEGSDVTVTARFDGERYVATTVTPNLPNTR